MRKNNYFCENLSEIEIVPKNQIFSDPIFGYNRFLPKNIFSDFLKAYISYVIFLRLRGLKYIFCSVTRSLS